MFTKSKSTLIPYSSNMFRYASILHLKKLNVKLRYRSNPIWCKIAISGSGYCTAFDIDITNIPLP